MATEPDMEDGPGSFWVRAMYDYHSTDDSSLTFSRGDIVEVLTQLESGWWDGLIGTERGWFPSNFVTVISDAEAEAELALRGGDPPAVVELDPTQLEASGSDSEWLQDELEQAAGIDMTIDLAEFVPREQTGNHAHSLNQDLWLPEVEPNGQIVYVNGLGQRRSELPAGPELDDITTPDPAQPSPQPSPRPQPLPIRQRANTATTSSSLGGFAFVARNTTPEPWMKRLTDDGHTFYYENRQTGDIVWSRPDPTGDSTRGPSTQQSLSSSASGFDLRARFRSAAPYDEVAVDADAEPDYDESDDRDSDPSHDRTLPANNRASVYSDASEVNPLGRESPFVRSATLQDLSLFDSEPHTDPAELQRYLAPSPPETIEELSAAATEAIDAVSRSMEEQPMPRVGLVAQVIVAVRNLLYVSGTLAPTPATLYPLVPGDGPTSSAPPAVSADLKQFQRKVTATLSKLVLSARAADSSSDASEDDAGARSRVAIDAGELERAVVRFVVEVRRASEMGTERRLRGVLATSNVGRGMPGGGVGGGWRGGGFIPGVLVGKALTVEVCQELVRLMAEVERGLARIDSGIERIEHGRPQADEGDGEGVSAIITHGRTVIAAVCALLNAAEDVDIAAKVGTDVEVKRGMVCRAGTDKQTIKRVGSRDELRRVGSRDELRRVGSRDELRKMGSRDALSRTGSNDALSRPGSKGGPGTHSPAIGGASSLSSPKPLDTSADVRQAVRRLEVTKQALYDAGVTLLLASQTVHVAVLKSAGTAPVPAANSEKAIGNKTTSGKGIDGDASAVSLVTASVTSIRRNGREMLALFDSLAHADPPEAYVSAVESMPRNARSRTDISKAEPYSRADSYSRANTHSRTDSYSFGDGYSRTDTYFRTDTDSRMDAYSRTSENHTISRAESYDILPRTDSSLMLSSADDQLATMYGGDPQYETGEEKWRERINGGRSRAGSVGQDRLDSVGRDRLDSVGSGRGTYGRAYPERGMYGGGIDRGPDPRGDDQERPYGGGDRTKPRMPIKHLDSAVSLPQSDISAESTNGQYSRTGTALGRSRPVDDLDMTDDDDDDDEPDSRSPPRLSKLAKILGDEAAAALRKGGGQIQLAPIVDNTPWYLKPTYNDPKQILTNTDGGVRGGTLPALVERLTMHDQLDATFIDSFLMTYKSFTTLQELFQLLVERFRITPPEGLTQPELEEWTEKKQKPARVRVVNIFRKMLLDSSVIDKEDGYIMDHIKAFAAEVVADVPPAKQLIVLVDRIQTSGDTLGRKYTATATTAPPPSILPKAGKRLKLIEMDATELARQLTILESKQYNAIKPIECLARARDEPAENDSIKTIITTTNKIASWVASSVLEKDDTRKRSAIIKQFIMVAERCRALHNYSSMAALIAGLNSPPIRRLKRTWDAVPQRWTAMLDDVESTLDSGKNFTGYKQRLKSVDSPCVPFLGVYLTVLTFIQDGNKDFISKEDGIINFGKRQKTAEVIREIQGYQAKQYVLTPVDLIQTFIEQSLTSVDEKADYWDRSLEMEPREREDEKMTRMLQESGFLSK